MKKAYVLLSGGIDSSTALTRACEDVGQKNVECCISIDYGQRHSIEIEYAKKVASFYGRPHKVIPVSTIPKTLLTDPTQEVPNLSYQDIEGVSPSYVPFRNGLMLSTVASYVAGEISRETPEDDQDIKLGGEEAYIYFGAHAEDAAGWAYPDCTIEFVGSMANAIYVGTYHKVRLITPFIQSMKEEIIRYGYRMGTPYHLTWSCYVGGEKHCGVCPTCRARKEAFISARVVDPTEYAS